LFEFIPDVQIKQFYILAGEAIERLPRSRIIGIPNNLYYHASPQTQKDKLRWLSSINELLP
jgi:hypothetical protein